MKQIYGRQEKPPRNFGSVPVPQQASVSVRCAGGRVVRAFCSLETDRLLPAEIKRSFVMTKMEKLKEVAEKLKEVAVR